MAICKAGVHAEGVYLSPVRISQSQINRIQVSKEPAPIYEPDVEKKTQTDIFQQSIYLKNNYNNAILSAGPKISPQNAQSPIYNTLYSVAQPSINGYPNTLALLNSYSHKNAVSQPYASILANKEVEVPLVQNVKTGIVPYSDASVVSHTTFTGLGTSYTW